MTTSEDSVAQAAGAYRWFLSKRDWLGRFPLSIIQLGMRIGVGMVFFKAGLLKYQSFEFARMNTRCRSSPRPWQRAWR